MTSASARRTAPAPIRKGTSQPQDPDAPSFLTTLPPELRNTIYESTYLQDKPIVIVDALEYTRWPAWECGEGDEYDSNDDGFGPLDQDKELQLTAYNYSYPVELLRTCRQVYHEASGTLYRANSFLVSVADHRHNGGCRQLLTATRWLEGLGSHYQLLNKVIVDVEARCPDSCEHNYSAFDFTPLVKLIWSRSSTNYPITFAKSGNLLDERVHSEEYDESTEVSSATRATLLNNVLTSLAMEDALDIRRYARPEWLILQIMVYRKSLEGRMIFASSDRGQRSPRDTAGSFDFTDDGTSST